mmetsp:Transcript_73033/g.123071  ORF Transcript_73033/g.123071 Transcript_73033/m.123071 type:complete len:275 (-) Transcript_73033:480-1304(-)
MGNMELFCSSLTNCSRPSSLAANTLVTPGSRSSSRWFSSSTSLFRALSFVGLMPSEASRTFCVHLRNAASTSGVTLPTRTLSSNSMNESSSCRKTVVSSTIAKDREGHNLLSNTNFICLSLFTGGSCSRSPLSTNWIPPKGLLLFPRMARPTWSSLSKRSASIIEISSTMRTLHFFQYVAWRSEREIFWIQFATSPSPRPMPAKEWSVMPPTSTAEIPVDAVTNVVLGSVIFTICRIKCVFPVPADPVKNTCRPSLMCLSTRICPSDRLRCASR